MKVSDQELEELKARLDEAEQTLDAIRHGEVEALLVSTAEGDRVFTLQGADHRYRRLVETMNEGAVLVSREGVILYANLAFSQLTEKPLDELVGGSIFDAAEDGGRDPLVQLLAIGEGESDARRELSLRSSTGAPLPVLVSASPNDPGEDLGICLIVADLREQERNRRMAALADAESAARREAERAVTQMLTVVETIPQLAWTATPDGEIDFFNERWIEYTGLSVEERAAQGWASRQHPDDAERARTKWVESLRTGEPYEFESRLRRRDGVYRWHLSRALPLRDQEGKIVRWFGTSTDIEEQRRAADRADTLYRITSALTRAKTLADVEESIVECTLSGTGADGVALFEKGDDGALVLRAQRGAVESRALSIASEGGEGHSIVADVITAGEASFSQADPISERGLAILPLLVAERPIAALLVSFAERHEFRADDRAFALTLANTSAQTLDRAHQFQSAEIERARAEAANRAKDEFLATVSHELRTPLNAMLGWARLLREGKVEPARHASALEIIERNAVAQAQLVEDILDVSRITTGKLRLDVQLVHPAEIIEAAVGSLRLAIQAKDIREQIILDRRAGPIRADPHRVQQIVWNLLSNAVKFTPKGGRVQVVLSRVNSHVEIEVSDSGPGVPPDFLPRLFERFFQADGSSTRRHGGLGLGLAIVRHLVELHGGSIHAENGRDGGARFVVSLPRSAVGEGAVPTPREHPVSPLPLPFEAPPELRGLHVLVVDDEGDASELLRVILEGCGARVTTRSSSHAGLLVFRSERPDVVLSDIGMPAEDGYTFVRKLRQLSPAEGGQTPAAALTAYASAEDRRRALVAGFQMHVAKPVEPAELVAVVANLARIAGALRG